MSKNIIPFHESNGSPDDPRPLPFLIAEMYNFSLQSHDTEDGVYYAIVDWIAGIASSDVFRAADSWRKLQKTLRISNPPLKYQDKHGKEMTVDFTDDEGLYRIAAYMRVTKNRPALKSIKDESILEQESETV